MLRDGVEDAQVPAEAALVSQRLGDVVGVDLVSRGRERVEAPAADRLDLCPSLHGSTIGAPPSRTAGRGVRPLFRGETEGSREV